MPSRQRRLLRHEHGKTHYYSSLRLVRHRTFLDFTRELGRCAVASTDKLPPRQNPPPREIMRLYNARSNTPLANSSSSTHSPSRDKVSSSILVQSYLPPRPHQHGKTTDAPKQPPVPTHQPETPVRSRLSSSSTSSRASAPRHGEYTLEALKQTRQDGDYGVRKKSREPNGDDDGNGERLSFQSPVPKRRPSQESDGSTAKEKHLSSDMLKRHNQQPSKSTTDWLSSITAESTGSFSSKESSRSSSASAESYDHRPTVPNKSVLDGGPSLLPPQYRFKPGTPSTAALSEASSNSSYANSGYRFDLDAVLRSHAHFHKVQDDTKRRTEANMHRQGSDAASRTSSSTISSWSKKKHQDTFPTESRADEHPKQNYLSHSPSSSSDSSSNSDSSYLQGLNNKKSDVHTDGGEDAEAIDAENYDFLEQSHKEGTPVRVQATQPLEDQASKPKSAVRVDQDAALDPSPSSPMRPRDSPRETGSQSNEQVAANLHSARSNGNSEHRNSMPTASKAPVPSKASSKSILDDDLVVKADELPAPCKVDYSPVTKSASSLFWSGGRRSMESKASSSLAIASSTGGGSEGGAKLALFPSTKVQARGRDC